jgi:hypothetical protein
MAFGDDMIRAIVKTGQYSDPEAEKYLADVIIKRRNKIGQAYLTRINPLVDFSLNNAGVMTFDNAAVKSGVAKPPASYTASWFTFDNASGTTRPIGETKGSSEKLSAPAGLPSTGGAYIMAEVRSPDATQPSSQKPVKVYFKRMGNGWKLVGLERMPDAAPPAATSQAKR